MISNKASQRFCIYFRPQPKFPTTSVHTLCIISPPSTRDACLNSPSAPSSRSPIPYRTRRPDIFGSVGGGQPHSQGLRQRNVATKTDFRLKRAARHEDRKTKKMREAQKNGNEPSHDETFPHRTYIEMKKLFPKSEQQGRALWVPLSLECIAKVLSVFDLNKQIIEKKAKNFFCLLFC